MSDNEFRQVVENSHEASKHGDYYDEVWAKLSDEYVTLQGYSKIRVEFIDYVISKYVTVDPEFHILDLGCGNGWLTAILSKYGNATGVDFAPRTIKQAQETYGQVANYLVADPLSPTLGLPSYKQYDLVVSSEVIEHVENHSAFVKQIRDFLKPNGWLILTTPNKKLWEYYRRSKNFEIYGQPVENWLLPDECIKLLKTEAFEVIWQEGWPDHSLHTPLQWLLCTKFVREPAKYLGIYHRYAKWIVPLSLFHMLIARKK